jgi:fucose 4-O-acetylase-like acetyltransferase
MEIKKYYQDMGILRGIGITLVVVGHSFPAQSLNNFFYRFINDFIYLFHMPLFFVISGFFAGKIFTISGIREYGSFVKTKFLRLMVPYFAVTMIAIPFKFMLNDFALRTMHLSHLLRNLFIYPWENPILFFWFLYTLFGIFVLAPLIKKLPSIIILMIFFITYLLPNNLIKVCCIDDIMHYSIFFFGGFFFNAFYSKYQQFRHKGYIAVGCLLALIVLNLFLQSLESSSALSYLLKYIAPLFGIVGCVSLSYLLQGGRIGNFFDYIGKFSFDIFLFSWFFQSGIRVLFFQVGGGNLHLTMLLMLVAGYMPIPFTISLSKISERLWMLITGRPAHTNRFSLPRLNIFG